MNPTTKRKIQDAAKNLSTVLVEVDLRCRQKVTLDSVGQRKRKQEITKAYQNERLRQKTKNKTKSGQNHETKR